MLNKARSAHLIRGEQAEQLACNHLLQQGLQLIARNFRCYHGELDLIMQEAQTLVIVEVRFRKSNKYGGALESITKAKQSRIIAATSYYLMQNNLRYATRFDVITIANDARINWIKNAFQ